MKSATGGTGGTSTSISKSVEKMTQADIDSLINDSAQNILGREITMADKDASWYKSLNKAIQEMVDSGSVTKQTVTKSGTATSYSTVTTPGYSREKATQLIESRLKSADPESLARKERVDFISWLNQNLGGR
jgi:hypothetical protein